MGTSKNTDLIENDNEFSTASGPQNSQQGNQINRGALIY